MNLCIELYHLSNNYANWHTLLLNIAFSAYYAQYRYRSPIFILFDDESLNGCFNAAVIIGPAVKYCAIVGPKRSKPTLHAARPNV